MKFFSTYFKDVKLELKKVTWLTKDEMIGSTVVVIIFAIIVMEEGEVAMMILLVIMVLIS